MSKLPKTIIGGYTYEKYAKECWLLLAENYNIDFLEVYGFNIYECWINGITVEQVIGICTGTMDSPFDQHLDIELEFADNYVAD